MTWKPVSLTELNQIVAHELETCSDEQRAYFETVALEPAKWSQSPYGDEGGGFWAIASDQDRVLWYNDIEGGFNVSRFGTQSASAAMLRKALKAFARTILNAEFAERRRRAEKSHG
jgi:hypothetical protein